LRVSIEAVPFFLARGIHSGHGHTAYLILAGMDGEENSAESARRRIGSAFKINESTQVGGKSVRHGRSSLVSGAITHIVFRVV
jgi:hypothetical protein